MEFVILILGMALVTFAARYSMIFIMGRWNVPQTLTRALTFVPMAAFAAIIAPELIHFSDGRLVVVNARLIAGIAAIMIALFTRHILLTIAVGMGTLWTIQFRAGR